MKKAFHELYSRGVRDHGQLAGLLDDDHLQYIHVNQAREIAVQHTFNPAGVSPFLVGPKASGILVEGLNAEYVGGKAASSFLSSDLFTANSIVKADTAATPAALTVSPSTMIGRTAAGQIAALSPATIRALLDLEPGTDFVAKTGGIFTGAVTVEGAADAIQLKVKAYSSQTVNIIEIQNSGGSALALINANGKVGLARIPNYRLDLQGITNEQFAFRALHTSNVSGCAAFQAYLTNTAVTADGGYTRAAANMYAYDNPSGDSNRELSGLYGICKTASDAYAHGTIRGLDFRAQHYGSGVCSALVGVSAPPYIGGSGQVNNAYGFYTNPWAASGTYVNWYGLYVGPSSLGTGSITNLRGIYIDNASAYNWAAGDFDIGGDCDVAGELTAGTKTFKIDHPADPLNRILYHMAIEGPRIDLVYRGTALLDRGRAEVDLDLDSSTSPMMKGTFQALTQNARVVALHPIDSFVLAKASRIRGNIFTIETDDQEFKGAVNWVVMAERADAYIRSIHLTDELGRLIPEHEKPEPDFSRLDPEIRQLEEEDIQAGVKRHEIEAEVHLSGKGYYLHPEAFGKKHPTRKLIFEEPVEKKNEKKTNARTRVN